MRPRWLRFAGTGLPGAIQGGRLRFMLAVALLGLLLTPAIALADDPLLPNRPPGAPVYGETVPLYDDERFPPYAYTFEGASQFNSIGHVPVYFWMNQLLVTKAWLLRLSLRLTEYALHMDFLQPLLDRAGGALTALGSLLWEGSSPLVTGALALAGLWAILLYMGGRVGRVWASLGGTILVVMAVAALLSAGPGWTRTANELSRELTRQTYGVLDRLARDGGWGLVARSGDALWRTLVYEPWVTGEFGSTLGASTYGQLNTNSFLARDLESRHLICGDRTRQKDYCPWWQNDFLPRRMLIAGWTFLAALAVSGALSLLSGGIILAQIALLFLLLLSPVWLLIALWWPGQGSRMLSGLLLRALGALVVQVVLAVTLGVLLLLGLIVTDLFDGWMLESLLLTLLALGAIRYRTAWLEPLAAARRWGVERVARRDGDREPRAARRSATVVGAGPTAPELIPLFAGFPPPVIERVEVAPLGPVDLPHGGRSLQRQEVATGIQVGSFRAEMQALRAELARREPIARPGAERLPEGEGAPDQWVPLPRRVDRDATGPEPAPAAARRRAAAARDRAGEITQVPSQRPRP